MIREATVRDIPRLLEMGKAFADEAGVTARVGWDGDDVAALLEGLILSADGIVLMSERGMIGGYVAPHPFNTACRLFVELFWRDPGGEGLALLRAAEGAAKERGASKSLMVAMDDMGRTRRLYGRIGYAPVEVQFMKELV